MSLIQQALEKTNRAQETRTTTPVQTSKPWERDLMGAALERELVEAQKKYARRRIFYWRVSVGVVLACLIAGISYLGVRQMQHVGKSSPSAVAIPVASQMPVRIYSGNIYRLTGITDLSGKAIAVINGQLVSVGDVLDGKAVVRAIGNGEVRLDVQGHEIKLVL